MIAKCQLGHAFNSSFNNFFSAWKDQGNQNVLAKYGMDAFGWEYDPSNPLGKEEQKKVWQASGTSASLVKKGANAFGIEKKESTKEEKKAKWMKGGGTLGLASKGLGALTFKDNKKKAQSEAYNIMDKCKTTGMTFGVANELVPLSQLKITMDTAKALNILKFPSHQTFESTSYESICTNFLTNLMMAMKNRKQAVMEAKGNKKGKKRTYQIEKDEESWRREVVKINEAFQVLCN